MTINLSFTFDNASDAADFLTKLNGEDWPSAAKAAKPAAEDDLPWNDAEPSGAESDSKASADPWAEDVKPAKPAKAQTNAQHDAAGVLWPPDTKSRVKDSPGGNRTWTFNLSDAPECDCGYPAAKVEGKKGSRTWAAWWCPLGFGPNWKDKCKFSEFA